MQKQNFNNAEIMILSVVKALNILTLLSETTSEGLSLVEISELIGQKVPTTFNLLETLESQEYIQRDVQSRRYSLGFRARQLGHVSTGVACLKELGAPVVAELGNAIGETVILTVYRQYQRHSILVWQSDQMLRVEVHPGVDRNMYHSATGRVMLSQFSPVTLQSFWDVYGEPGAKWEGIASLDELCAALRPIREAGQLLFESQPGQVRALAVPLVLEDCFPAALGLYYPLSRHPDDSTARHFLAMMKTAADQLMLAWQRMNTPEPIHEEQNTHEQTD